MCIRRPSASCIVLPRICTRHVKADIELPSPKVAVLRFGHERALLMLISAWSSGPASQ
ncbi:hypothetical protein K503DRAFT_765406 [Rhizopogon vinicolor AM-OR11-026]|uniref:Uncharacterized protein n=1 Tax=Rhizopogon vinicolor AM-OR11-026 TaxID=1314800 RepID=A0A1B7NGJ1_9AGAM|nr:hypothetical protein K503DRAFT_765406 [Rhizopogon vinicolor AM-OR11-026]